MKCPEQANLHWQREISGFHRIEGRKIGEWLLIDNRVSFGGDKNILKLVVMGVCVCVNKTVITRKLPNCTF